MNEVKHPIGCKNDECQYKANWELLGKDLSFTITGKTVEGDWLGFGFSSNQVMPDTDIILGYFDEKG